jgi:hypothetical protein
VRRTPEQEREYHRNRQRAYRAADPVLKRIRDADYHDAHREERCKAMREYYAANRDQRRAAQADYRKRRRLESQ